MLIVYINDINLLEDDTTKITRLKRKMGDKFEIKDLGNLKYTLGWRLHDQWKESWINRRNIHLPIGNRYD